MNISNIVVYLLCNKDLKIMKVIEKISPMLAENREKRIFTLENNGNQMSKLQFSVYEHSSYVGRYILEFQYNGHMGDGGMKRGIDNIKNWPTLMLKTAMLGGLKETAHGNLSYSIEPIQSVSLSKMIESAKIDLKKLITNGGW